MKPEEGKENPTTTLEAELKDILSDEEYETLLTSLYVLIDFGLDFVAEDYNITDQNLLGTMIYNISNILQTHQHDITYSWVRSYDSFYSDIKYVCAHSYGEWNIVKEASAEDYGVRTKTCERCHESVYEAIPKTVEKENLKFPASLFGEGSITAIILCSIAMVAIGVAIYLHVRLKKETTESKKDDE
jgi:hypothetical protein